MYSLFQNIIHIIPTVIHTILEDILKPGYKISSENGPLHFGKNVVVPRHKAMLKCISKTFIKLVPNSCMRICGTKVFSTSITLGYDGNAWKAISN